MNQQHISEIAGLLWTAEQQGQPCAPLRERIVAAAAGGDPVACAYAVQQHNARRRIEGGARVVGRKIGLTSTAVQAQLGVDSPDFGILFADMAYGDGEAIPLARTLQPKVEAEIALVLERDLTFERHTFADLVSATAYALPAIEVVGSRIQNWEIKLLDTVADNASSSAFVLGSRPVRLGRLDLVNCAMAMERRGETVSEGSGAACLANPLNAAVWLADMMVRVGTPLRAGEVLLTGALGPMVAVAPGDQFVARIEGLGELRAVFGN
jgi:2-keto-4-pentenoate hydratase